MPEESYNPSYSPTIIISRHKPSQTILNYLPSETETQFSQRFQRWLDSPQSTEAIRRNVAVAERFVVTTNKPSRLTALERLEEVTI